MTGVNVFEKATEAAKKAGAAYPEAVAEYIQDRLAVVDSLAGPTVMARNGLERESLDAAMARLKVTEKVSACSPMANWTCGRLTSICIRQSESTTPSCSACGTSGGSSDPLLIAPAELRRPLGFKPGRSSFYC